MILFLSIFINFLFVYAIIDLHYRSLKIASKVQCNESIEPLAKRVVLFISDGLSANQLYRVTAKDHNDSFIRSIMEGNGSWGVSETHVPTMTYTAVTTITTGTIYTSINVLIFGNYKLAVDNVFNYANVYYVGDYTALSYLKNFREKWHKTTWNSAFIDTVNKDYIKYDKFGCEQIAKLLQNKTIEHKLNQSNTAFIIYLPAVDFCGHHVGPLMPQCIEIVKHVDKCVGNTVKLFNERFTDGRTSFIMTADHGMTDSGNHGSGAPQMKQTPILAWGAGIKTKAGVVMEHPQDWQAEGLKRINIKQSDIASFISVLLGNPIPADSYGTIPRHFLEKQDMNLAKALYCNANQLDNMLKAQGKLPKGMEEKQKTSSSLFIELKKELHGNNATAAIMLAEPLLKLLQEELYLLRISYKGVITKLITILYTGWGLWLFLRTISSLYNVKESGDVFPYLYEKLIKCEQVSLKWNIVKSCLYDLLFIFLACTSLYVAFQLKKWPSHFSIYIILSLFVWWRATKNLKVIWNLFENIKSHKMTVFYVIACMLSSLLVIVSVNRSIYRKYLLFLVSLIEIYFCRETITNCLSRVWLGSTFLLTAFVDLYIFNKLPTVSFVMMATTFWIMSLVAYANITKDKTWAFVYIVLFILVQWNLVTIFYFASVDYKLSHTMVSWCVLLIGPFICLLSPYKGFKKLCHFCFGIGTVFLLFTTRKEGLGFFSIVLFLILWYSLEVTKAGKDILTSVIEKKKRLVMTNDDLRRGFMLLLYTWCCYFASGFRDYPSNFDIKWTNYFMETFEEYPIIVLVIVKMLLPFTILCSVISAMYNTLEIDKAKFLEWYLFLNNTVSLYFFHCTKGEEHDFIAVGYSLAHHLLSNLFPVIVVAGLPITNMLLNARIKLDPKSYFDSNIYE